jgi:hypothetical protein
MVLICFNTKKHQIIIGCSYISVQNVLLMTKIAILGLFKVKLVHLEVSKIFQVLAKRSSSPGTGMAVENRLCKLSGSKITTRDIDANS